MALHHSCRRGRRGATPSATAGRPFGLTGVACGVRGLCLGLALAAGATAMAQPATTATATAPADAARVGYDIPAGPLGPALSRFAASAGITLSFEPSLTEGRTSAGLRGRHALGDGFSQLLAGSGLEAVPRAGGGYTLRRAAAAAPPLEAPAGGQTLAEVRVTAQAEPGGISEGTGAYGVPVSSAATRLSLPLQQTPQSVSVITRQQMDDQGLLSISDVLQQTPGVTVNRDNTEGYSFYSRGFQIQNFLFDGVPSLSSDGGNVRDNYSIMDSAIYDRVEILKGAAGLVSGAGYPAGAINFIRKRPTIAFQGHASIGAGSWDHGRTELDLSGPLGADGRIRGRIVAAAQHAGSFIEHLKSRQGLVYGIFEADVAASTMLSLGFDVQRNRNNATTNGNLPAFYADGTPARFPRSTNAADIWAYRNHDTRHLFGTLDHEFGSGWTLKANAGWRGYTSREVIAGMSSATIDPLTHAVDHGFYPGGAARFDTDTWEKSLDLQLSGRYALLGRTHQVVLGYSRARTNAVSNRSDGDTDPSITDAFHWNNNATQPTAYEWWSKFDVNARQQIAYAATVLTPYEHLSLILGARVTRYAWSLDSVNAIPRSSRAATEVNGKLTPYAGLTYDIDGRHTAYASYTDIFKPQAYNFDANNRQLDPLTGKSFEIGVKGRYFDNKLNASAALFRIQQDNQAEPDPSGATRPDGGAAYIAIQGVRTTGLELELAGELQPGWQLNGGYVYRESHDAKGQPVSTIQPEHLLKLATSYRLPAAWRRLSIGGSLQWQSRTYFTQTIAGAPRDFVQPGYAVAGLMLGYDFSRQLKATVNFYNLTDRTYYAGIGNYNTVYYGAPRSVVANLKYQF